MANEVYQKHGTLLKWSDLVGGAITDQLDLNNLAADAKKAGSFFDRGDLAVIPGPDEYEWQLVIDGTATNPAATGNPISLYFAQGDTMTQFSGKLDTTGLTDTVQCTNAPSTAGLANLMYAGAVLTRTLVSTDVLISRGIVRFSSRYVVPVVHNQLTVSLRNTAAHILTLTPIYYQTQ